MKFLNFKPLDLADTTVDAASAPIDLSQIYKLSVQAVVGAGSAMTGSIQLQVSNDELNNFYLNQKAPTNWNDLGSPLALAAASTNYLIPVQDVCYRSLRVMFTSDPGNDAPVVVNIMALAI